MGRTQQLVPQPLVARRRGQRDGERGNGRFGPALFEVVFRQGEGHVRDEQGQLGIDDLVGQPAVPPLGPVREQRAADEVQGVAEQPLAHGRVPGAPAPGRFVVEGAQHVQVGDDGDGERETARRVQPQPGRAVRVGSEPLPHPLDERVPDVRRHPARPQRGGEDLRVHTLAVQQEQGQRLVQEHAALAVRGGEPDELVRPDKPGVDGGPAALGDVDEEGGGRRVGARIVVGFGVLEELDHRVVLGPGQHLRLEVETQQRGEQPALGGDVELPDRSGHMVRSRADEIADPQPARVGGEFGEPCGLGPGGLGGEEDEMRGPAVVLYVTGAAGEDGVVAGRTQGAAALPGLGLHDLQQVLHPFEMTQPGGGQGAELLAEAHQRDGHPVRPAAGGQFRGDRGQHGGAVLRGSGQ